MDPLCCISDPISTRLCTLYSLITSSVLPVARMWPPMAAALMHPLWGEYTNTGLTSHSPVSGGQREDEHTKTRQCAPYFRRAWHRARTAHARTSRKQCATSRPCGELGKETFTNHGRSQGSNLSASKIKKIKKQTAKRNACTFSPTDRFRGRRLVVHGRQVRRADKAVPAASAQVRKIGRGHQSLISFACVRTATCRRSPRPSRVHRYLTRLTVLFLPLFLMLKNKIKKDGQTTRRLLALLWARCLPRPEAVYVPPHR